MSAKHNQPSRLRHRQTKQSAFTLLELVVATAIFSILSVVAYNGLRNFMSAHEVLADRDLEFSTLHSGINLIERDVKNAITRRVRDELGDHVAAMRSSENVLEFTRHRPGIPAAFSLVDMVRIDYVFSDNTLIRRAWHMLDRVPQTEFDEQIVLVGVSSLSWQFYQGGWQEFWPRANDPFSQSRLPQAVRLIVNLDNGRSVERVILINNQS